MDIRTVANPAAPYLARVFGIRDVVLTVLTASADEQDRRRLVQGLVVIDVCDVVSALISRRAGHLSEAGGRAATLAAVAALMPELGWLAANRDR
ncbi:hypothetical protein [Jannaschia sp. R86511]|uniref:hypothetical protein n=1 Tax=Jannaschia sp. R86511 TaxID=3093853 RepID=UPI0036D30E21